MITEQIGKGESYKLATLLSQTQTDKRNRSISQRLANFTDKNTGSKFTDILEINTLELVPSHRKETDNTMLWNWLQF